MRRPETKSSGTRSHLFSILSMPIAALVLNSGCNSTPTTPTERPNLAVGAFLATRLQVANIGHGTVPDSEAQVEVEVKATSSQGVPCRVTVDEMEGVLKGKLRAPYPDDSITWGPVRVQCPDGGTPARVTATVDPNDLVEETNEDDNTAPFGFLADWLKP